MILFIQYLQSFITFRNVAFIKTNIVTSFYDFTLKWYILELSNFDQNALNNNSVVKSWINTLFHYFKVSINVALGILIDETYFLNYVQA